MLSSENCVNSNGIAKGWGGGGVIAPIMYIFKVLSVHLGILLIQIKCRTVPPKYLMRQQNIDKNCMFVK